MAQRRHKIATNKSYCFRGIRFQIHTDDLPEAVRESRRFHATLVQELVSRARQHARALARGRAHRERSAL